jgi:hypothetical protein
VSLESLGRNAVSIFLRSDYAEIKAGGLACYGFGKRKTKTVEWPHRTGLVWFANCNPGATTII